AAAPPAPTALCVLPGPPAGGPAVHRVPVVSPSDRLPMHVHPAGNFRGVRTLPQQLGRLSATLF
ncbi:MAG: hypothetical protein ACRD4Q_15485, partial [Candidatus Acidiferrales bacterium]